jgi:hypothetical protein
MNHIIFEMSSTNEQKKNYFYWLQKTNNPDLCNLNHFPIMKWILVNTEMSYMCTHYGIWIISSLQPPV